MKETLAEVGESVAEADAALAETLEPYAQSLPVRAIGLLSEVGDQPPMRVLCASVIGVGLIGWDRRLTRAGLRMLAAHTLATWAKSAIKARIDRVRPRSMGDDDGHVPRPGNSRHKELSSFPSGHSAGAAAVARAFAKEYPEHAGAAYAAAGAIALAQIPRCAHYVSDVGAGIAIGVAADALVDVGVRLMPETAP